MTFSELVELDRQGKHICLVCFCRDEALYHRSVIAGILQHTGVSVHGVKGDYSRYGRLYADGKKHALQGKKPEAASGRLCS